MPVLLAAVVEEAKPVRQWDDTEVEFGVQVDQKPTFGGQVDPKNTEQIKLV